MKQSNDYYMLFHITCGIRTDVINKFMLINVNSVIITSLLRYHRLDQIINIQFAASSRILCTENIGEVVITPSFSGRTYSNCEQR